MLCVMLCLMLCVMLCVMFGGFGDRQTFVLLESLLRLKNKNLYCNRLKRTIGEKGGHKDLQKSV